MAASQIKIDLSAEDTTRVCAAYGTALSTMTDDEIPAPRPATLTEVTNALIQQLNGVTTGVEHTKEVNALPPAPPTTATSATA